MSHGGVALAALLVALPLGAARADAPPPTLGLLAPCGHELVYPAQGDDPGSTWHIAAARDEGGGFVSQLTEVSGHFASREIELVDCRAGAELFVSDRAIAPGMAWPLPAATAYASRLAALRDTGGLRDLAAVEQGIGAAGNPIPLAVDWGQNLRAACACEHFYPGSSGLPPDQIPAPDRVHGVDAPVTSD